MTNEEAKVFLQSRIDLIDKYYPQVEDYREALDMAIKALEQQPCEDCISRKETIEWLKKVTVTDGITFKTGFEQILYDIEQMPSVTPKTEWIPVSERLPEAFGGDYLVTIEHKGEVEGVDQATYGTFGYIDGLWDTVNDWIEGYSEDWHVTAWMPLPEPYKAESEEEE